MQSATGTVTFHTTNAKISIAGTSVATVQKRAIK